jgi:hypothetical protein
MSAKSVLSGVKSKKSKSVHILVTKLSGYVDTETPKRCNTCRHFVGKNLCNNHLVARDPQVRKDDKTGLKIVAPVSGCCDEWHP